jgi:hypothetical protein
MRTRVSRTIAMRRSLLLGATLSILTVAGHCLAEGALPSPASIVLVSAVMTALASTVSGRAPRFWPLLLVVLGAQVLGHLVLSLSSHHAHGATPAMAALHAGAAALSVPVLLHADWLAERWAAFWACLSRPRPALIALPVAGAVLIAPGPARIPDSSHSRSLRGRAPPVSMR